MFQSLDTKTLTQNSLSVELYQRAYSYTDYKGMMVITENMFRLSIEQIADHNDPVSQLLGIDAKPFERLTM